MTIHDDDEKFYDKLLRKAQEKQLCKRCGYPVGDWRRAVKVQPEEGVVRFTRVSPLRWRDVCSWCAR